MAWILVAFGILRTSADPDLWGHVRFGLDILRDRGLVSIDPYSFTQDVAWMNHEWLSELVMGLAHRTAGPLGLAALKALLAAGTYVVVYTTLRHVSEPVRWPSFALVAWSTLPIAWTLRPQLWTLLLLALLTRILVTGRGISLVPLLFLVWTNLHGGWIVGLGVLAVWSAGRLVDAPDGRTGATLAGIVALSAVATLVNPYGWHMWQFIASTVGLSRGDITEWSPLWDGWQLAASQWIAAMAFVAAVWWRLGRPSVAALAVLGVLAFTSARVNRVVPLFVLAAVMLLADRLPRAASPRAPRTRTLADAAALVIVLTLSTATGVLPRCIAIDGLADPDVMPAEMLRAARARGRMVTWFNWGEYAIWHLGPDLKVSVDGRRETIYSTATLAQQYAIASGRPEGFEALSRMRPEYVWLPDPFSRPTAEWLEENGYRIDIQTDRSFVAVRADLPVVNPVAVTPTGCFPGP